MTQARAKEAPVFFPALDTLRGVLSLTVLVFHVLQNLFGRMPGGVWPWMATPIGAGAFAVPFFFVLSSFLITHLLLEEKARAGRVSVPAFYGRRVLRVWPVYFLALVLALFVVEPWAGNPSSLAWGVPFALFYGNNLMGLVPAIGNPSMAVAPLWSVCIEEQFYVAWPWVLKMVDERALAWVGVGLVAVAFFSRDFLFETGHSTHLTLWFQSLTHVDCFGVGVVACLVHRAEGGEWLKRHLTWVALACLAVAVTVHCTVGSLGSSLELRRQGVYAYSLVPVLGGVLVLAAARPAAGLSRFWNNPVGQWLGRVSYGVYAYHGLGIILFGRANPVGPAELAWRTLGMLAFPLAMAAVSSALMERPLLRLKSRLQVVPSGA